MINNLLKKILKLYYRQNSEHYILTGPMRGMMFRVNNVTQLMPLYSGNERPHQMRFKELLTEGDVIIDIGANWGLHTLYTSTLVGKTGKVVSVEPFLPAFVELEWHIAKNNCKNVVALNFAVGEFDGEIKIFSKDNSSQGVVFDCVNKKETMEGESFVEQKKLDTIVQELKLKKIDLIKVDVEGAEHHVLEGGKQAVDKFRPCFIIDLHNPENDIFTGKWFTERGYKLERVDKSLSPILKTDKGWPDKEGVWGSLLAIP